MESSPQNHIEAFYDLPGVEGVTKFVHWIDAQLMAWSAFFLVLSLVLIGLDNTTSYVSESGFLSGLLGLAFAISVESQGRILLKYARMSWDNGQKGTAVAWAISSAPVVAVAFVLAWSYMVKAAEGVTYAQATQVIGLSVRDVEFGRAATLIYLVCMSALAYFVKPRESLAQKLAAKHEEAELAKADAEIIEAKRVRQNAMLRSAAAGAADARTVGAAVLKGHSALTPQTQMQPEWYVAPMGKPDMGAIDRALSGDYGNKVTPARSFFSIEPIGPDDDDPTPPTTPAPPTQPGRGRSSGSLNGMGARGRPSLPITAYRDSQYTEETGASRGMLSLINVQDVKDFLLSESRRYSLGQRSTVPTQQEVFWYLNSCGYGLKGINNSVKSAIANALHSLAQDGVTLAWDKDVVAQAVNA